MTVRNPPRVKRARVRSGKTRSHYSAENNEFSTSSDGFYAGVSTSYYFEQAGGNLTGSIAVASLDGEVTLNEPLVDTSAFTVTGPIADCP